MIEFKFHYDGTSIVLDEPVTLPVNKPLVAKVEEPLSTNNDPVVKPTRVWGQFRGLMSMSPDFNEELPDSFWGFDEPFPGGTKNVNTANRIQRDPNIMLGKPCVKGTRLTVQLILERLAYHPVEELMASYPELKKEDIQAAILYAANEVGSKMVIEKSELVA